MEGERRVAGLWCREVLATLADYVDDELEAGAREQVQTHLAGCDVCERFGGEYAGAVRAIRTALEAPAPVEESVKARLLERLSRW